MVESTFKPGLVKKSWRVSSHKGWEKRFFFVSGYNLEFYPWEKPSLEPARVKTSWLNGVSTTLNMFQELSGEEEARIARSRAYFIKNCNELLLTDYLGACWSFR